VGAICAKSAIICSQNPGAYITLTANSNFNNYQWLSMDNSLSCYNCASTIATPSVTTTYTVTTSSICNSVTQTITVSVENCFCNNGTTLASSVTLIDNTTFASAVTFGVNQYLTVNGNITLTNKELYFAPNYAIYVPTGSSLTLDHCHLLTCADMWQGIIVSAGASLKIKNNCMIEDAFEAVNCSNWNQSATSNTLSVDGCVFNKNLTGIDISNYTYSQAFPATIRNAVFTSRTLATTANATNWSTAATPASLKQVVSVTSPLQTPYRIANTAAYAPTSLNAPLQGSFPNYGIYLGSIGSCAQNGSVINIFNPAYYDLTIGDGTSTTYLNMFDELYYGIYAVTANFTCVNNVFESLERCASCPRNLATSGTAIYALNGQVANQIYTRARVIFPTYSQTTNPKVGVVGMPAYNNKFYDCIRGTYILSYTEVDIAGADIRSTQVAPASSLIAKGSYGFFVSTPVATNIFINSNKVTNINNGILFNLSSQPGYTKGQYLHSLTVNYNIMSANLGNTPTTQYINNGIVCDNLLNCYSNSSPSVCFRDYFIKIDSNTIENVYRGIEASNWLQNFKFPPEINYNYISVVENSFNPTMTHFGINATSNLGIKIYDNVVQGPSINNLNIRGIYHLDNVAGTSCNSVYNLGKGFEYEGPVSYSGVSNTLSGWENNIMNTNQRGFILTNNAVIGSQGGPYTIASSGGPVQHNGVCDNQWQGTWAGSNFGTFVDINSQAPLSPLYVRSNSLPFFPPNNQAASPGNDYFQTNSIIIPTINVDAPVTCTVLPQAECVNCRLTTGQSPQSTSQPYLNIYEKVALDSISYVALQAQNNFRSQQKLFRMMQMDSTISDSSVILQNFYNSTLATNINTFGNIESALLNGDFTTAQSLNGSVTANSLIEGNHKLVYDAIIKTADSTFSSGDSLNLYALASSCPAINGDAVYQARVLYNNIYNSYQYFENNCNYDSIYQVAPSARKAASIANNIIQQNNSYLIYPNPTTGRVYISGANGSDKELSIDIMDITGRSMLKQILSLSNGIAQLQTNLPNGVYMIQIKGSDGKVVVQRLIVSN
jgi:hypothetical protein